MSQKEIRFPQYDPQKRLENLALPGKPVDAVIDTDTYNEIDDQFAIAYAMLSPDKFNIRAITAAPFFNSRSSGPADGMEKSYDEILRVLALLGHSPENFVFKGADRYLPDRNTPVDTPAARRIIELAREAGAKGEMLYVLAIAAITNVASALLLAPEISGSIVVVWLGGNPVCWPDNSEFNLRQDVPAAQVIFDSGVPLIWIPCMTVAELLHTTPPELEMLSRNSGDLGKYLFQSTCDYLPGEFADGKPIWDIATVAMFTVPQAFLTVYLSTPVLNDDRSWQEQADRHMLKMVYHIDRNTVFADMFRRFEKFVAEKS